MPGFLKSFEVRSFCFFPEPPGSPSSSSSSSSSFSSSSSSSSSPSISYSTPSSKGSHSGASSSDPEASPCAFAGSRKRRSAVNSSPALMAGRSRRSAPFALPSRGSSCISICIHTCSASRPSVWSSGRGRSSPSAASDDESCANSAFTAPRAAAARASDLDRNAVAPRPTSRLNASIAPAPSADAAAAPVPGAMLVAKRASRADAADTRPRARTYSCETNGSLKKATERKTVDRLLSTWLWAIFSHRTTILEAKSPITIAL